MFHEAKEIRVALSTMPSGGFPSSEVSVFHILHVFVSCSFLISVSPTCFFQMRWKCDYIGCCVEDCSGSKKWKRITIVQNCISGTKLVPLIGIHAIIIRLLQEMVFHPPLPKYRGFWDVPGFKNQTQDLFLQRRSQLEDTHCFNGGTDSNCSQPCWLWAWQR